MGFIFCIGIDKNLLSKDLCHHQNFSILCALRKIIIESAQMLKAMKREGLLRSDEVCDYIKKFMSRLLSIDGVIALAICHFQGSRRDTLVEVQRG